MLYALHYILFLHTGYGLLYHGLVAHGGQTHEFLSSERAKVRLDLGKDELDRVVLRAVRYVVDPPKAVVPHGLLGPIRGVRRQVVHKDGYLGVRVRRS